MMRQSLQIVRRMSSDLIKKLETSPNPNKLFGPTLQHWLYAKSGFNQYGLHRDDMLHESPVVIEALRRLDQKTLDERNFRIVRAGYLCMRKDILPKEQWTKLEEDVMYLHPIIAEVEKEIAEKKAWDNE